MPVLVLLRHGESAWNAEDRFTGWVDVDLTLRGEEQARCSGRLLAEAGLRPAVVHTSCLRRAVRSSHLLLAAAGWDAVPVRQDWRLNERCYGALQGLTRRSVRAQHGGGLYDLWRRSYDVAPPDPGELAALVGVGPAAADEPTDQGVGPEPRAESLADVVARLVPCWRRTIGPDLTAKGTVLVVAHSNSLRALVAHLDGLTPDEVMGVNIPTGMPLRYDLDDNLLPRRRGGEYLEPEAAARASQIVADLGR